MINTVVKKKTGSSTGLPQENFCLTGPALQVESPDLQFPCVGPDARVRRPKEKNLKHRYWNQLEKNHSTHQERPCTIVQTVRAKVSFSLSVI